MALSHEERRAALKAVALHNIGVLRSFLVEQGIATVDIEFNGYGDEGMIDEISTPENPDEVFVARRFTEARIEGLQDCFIGADSSRVEEAPAQSFRGACERAAMSLLEVDYAGWETDGGSSGTVTVGPDMLTVDIRMVSVELDTQYYDPANGLEHLVPGDKPPADDPAPGL